jgi:hypothetical protein
LTQRIKEHFQGCIFSLLSDQENLTGFPIENDRKGVMAFLDGNFIDYQKARMFIHWLRKLGRKILFMNGFDGFPVQVKVIGNLFAGHHLTEKQEVLSESLGDPFPGIDKVQFFNGIPAGRTFDGSVSNPQNSLSIKTVEISDHPFMVGMDLCSSLLTVVTDRVIAFIWIDGHGHQLFFLIIGLFGNFHSTKIKKGFKIDLGHRLASSGRFLLIQILYPEKQAVSIFI